MLTLLLYVILFCAGFHYEPGNPARARIATFGESWFWPLAAGGIGLLLIAAGAATSRSRRRHAASATGQGSAA